MKNRFFVTIILIFLIFSQAIAFSQDVVSDVNISEQTSEQDQTSASDQSNDELEQIKSEIAVIKKDLEEVKERTSWMQFYFRERRGLLGA
jgi:Skp family chaperone for outer membrane proteins